MCHKIVRERTNATELFTSEQTERRSQDAEVEYRDHIGFENKRLENEIHSRMTAYRAAMGGEELTMMQSWIIRFI